MSAMLAGPGAGDRLSTESRPHQPAAVRVALTDMGFCCDSCASAFLAMVWKACSTLSASLADVSKYGMSPAHAEGNEASRDRQQEQSAHCTKQPHTRTRTLLCA